MSKHLVRWVSIILLPILLAGCESAEERAQGYYERGMALLAEGDVDRALLEFRNVFKLNETHRDARLAYARAQEGRGNLREAYGQYLRLVEQYPEDLEGRRALVQLASNLNNWEEVERHVSAAETLAPEDPVIQSVRAGLDYRNALRNQDTGTAALAVKVSETLLSDNPDLPTARRVVIDDLLRRQEWNNALTVIDTGLAGTPGEPELLRLRLGVLEQLGRNDDIIAQLKEMVADFPDEGLHRVLVNRYMAEGRLDQAEAYLRERVAWEGADGSEARMELIAFLTQNVGRDAGIAEIDRILRESSDRTALFRSVKAGLEFDAGRREEAIAEIESILKDTEPSEETDRIKVALARMLIATGNSVGARARVEEVLARDPGQVEAIKLKAGWLIEDDQPGDALVELRKGLDQAPRDAVLLTLMAQAHERAGNRDLMGEMLALATEASGSAPAESLRYAAFLVEDEKLLPAEDVLQDALRLQNASPLLLGALGDLYVRMKDWPRAQAVIDRLGRLGTDEGAVLVNELTARKLAAQNQAEELESFLAGLAEGESGLQAAASILRLRLARGDIDGALAYARDLLSNDPGNPTLRFLDAGVLIAAGRQQEAAGILQDLLAENPENERAWLALYRVRRSGGDEDAAARVLSDAQAALPDSANLKWIEASAAELRGDIDRAIDIYEELYAANSSSVVVANNLASLISNYREGDENLERAYEIARRLRGTDIPAFQDTYGWIAFRLGNLEEALEYLEPAARALPEGVPEVQYHLAETYAALGRESEALEMYTRAAEMIAAGGRPRPSYMDRVEAEIARLSP